MNELQHRSLRWYQSRETPRCASCRRPLGLLDVLPFVLEMIETKKEPEAPICIACDMYARTEKRLALEGDDPRSPRGGASKLN